MKVTIFSSPRNIRKGFSTTIFSPVISPLITPLIVSIDAQGRNLFEENKVIFNQRKDKAVEEICKHVGFIK